MLAGPIEKVDLAALRALVENAVPEGKTIEYKGEMPGKARSDVVPFLAAVSSFANTAGGDLLVGVTEDKGVPTELVGVDIGDPDQEKLRLEQIIRSGLEPRLPRLDIRFVDVAGRRQVLVIRVPDSWVAPHRVTANSKFYARSSAGRYELDVGELRTAFGLSEAIAARIRDFRADRIARVHGRQTPVPLGAGGSMVVHVVPLGAFRAGSGISMAALQEHSNRVLPLGGYGSGGARINLDGIVTCSDGPSRPSDGYA